MPPLKGVSLYQGIFDPAPPEQQQEGKAAEKAESKTAWSPALRFAPRKTAKSKPRPKPALVASLAAPVQADQPAIKPSEAEVPKPEPVRLPSPAPVASTSLPPEADEHQNKRKRGERSANDGEEDDYDEEEAEWSERRQRVSKFGPPSWYATPPSSSSSGQEAYARRAAMAGEEAYQRRLAMAQQPTTAMSDLASRQSVAAAIAARLAQQAPQESPPAEASDPHTFASRLMTKYGHVAGTPLNERGLLTPLTTATTSAGRGSIVHPHPEHDPYGPASEIVLLENMITPQDASEPDLAEDIGAECAKFGNVLRVMPLFASSRVFVHFTGAAGAYRAVRALDGRFFAGKTVSARYYSRRLLDRGIYDDAI